MILFVVTHKGEVYTEIYTSLKMACDDFGLNYSSASKGKRIFVNKKNEITSITEAKIKRIKGRENNSKGKNTND